MVVTKDICLMEVNGHVIEVVSLTDGEWSCSRGGQFKGGEWSCYRGGQFNGERMVLLRRWPV